MISAQAFEFVDEQSRRFLKDKHWFESIAIPGVRSILNAFHRPAGSLVAMALQAPLTLGEREFKSRSRWARHSS